MALLPAPVENSWWCHPFPWPRIRRLWSGRRWLSATMIKKGALSRATLKSRIVLWNEENAKRRTIGDHQRGNFLPFIRGLKVGTVGRGTWEISFWELRRNVCCHWTKVDTREQGKILAVLSLSLSLWFISLRCWKLLNEKRLYYCRKYE